MLIPTGFWTYATSDEANSRGKLSQLRALLAGELQQQIGRSPKVNIFQDVVAIPPGAEWDGQIRAAIAASSFLIPVVTPGFLQSEWCCQEVNLFRERERSLGAGNLVFPLHYVDVSEVDEDNPNECHDASVLAFLRTRQWTDYRSLRLRSQESEEISLLLERLARGVLKALREGGAKVRQTEAAAKRRADEAAAAQRARDDAEARRRADKAAESQRAEERADAKTRVDEAAAVRRARERADAKRLADNVASAQRAREEADAKRRTDELAEAQRSREGAEAERRADEAAAAQRAEDEVSKQLDPDPADANVREAQEAQSPPDQGVVDRGARISKKRSLAFFYFRHSRFIKIAYVVLCISFLPLAFLTLLSYIFYMGICFIFGFASMRVLGPVSDVATRLFLLVGLIFIVIGVLSVTEVSKILSVPTSLMVLAAMSVVSIIFMALHSNGTIAFQKKGGM